MEKEKVLEIEITKINDEWSAWYIKKINERKLKHINPNELDKLDSNILCFGCGEIYPKTKFDKERIDRVGLYGEYYEYQINLEIKYKNNYDEPYFIKNEYVEDLKSIVNLVNEKYGIPKRWRGERSDKYFSIFGDSEISETTDNYFLEDQRRYEWGNYFKTLEEAEKVKVELDKFWAKVRAGEIGND